MVPQSTQLAELLLMASNIIKGKTSNPSAGMEVRFLRGLIDIFMAAPQKFTGPALDQIDQIMCELCERADHTTCQEIAATFAQARIAPRGITNQLARHDMSIAEPLLRHGAMLNDDDLLAIIHQRGTPHHMAIARRYDVSYAIGEALLALNNEAVTVSLLKNQRAHFRPHTLDQLAETSKKMPSLRAPLTGRHDLDPILLTQLYFQVPAALKSQILNRSEVLDPALISEAITINRTSLLQPGQETENFRHFVHKRSIHGQINQSLMKQLISEKRLNELVLTFAYLTGVDEPAAKAIMRDTRFESLAIACRATGIHRDVFSRMVFGLLLGDRDKTNALRILDLYQKIPTDAAEKLMRFWRLRSQAVADAGQTIVLEQSTTSPQTKNSVAS
ncbi:DUF2336 domain-containing protein [Hyphococcus lacteus]|uniref:DUF2336 domain-containing protein n=1 Tax=Hyphococcus lacteus TaxID=3143536 RepID=A0ABV3Z2D0_9PROT